MDANLENVVTPVVQGEVGNQEVPKTEFTYEDMKKMLSIPEKGREYLDKLHEEFNLKIPSYRLKEEADKRRVAEAKIAELEKKFQEVEGVSSQELAQYKQWYQGVETFLNSNPDVMQYIQDRVKENQALPANAQQAIPTNLAELEAVKKEVEGLKTERKTEAEAKQVQQIVQEYTNTRDKLFKEYNIPGEWQAIVDKNARRTMVEIGATDLSHLDYVIAQEWEGIKKVEEARLTKLAKDKTFEYVQKKKADAVPAASKGKVNPAATLVTNQPVRLVTREARQAAIAKAIEEASRSPEST